MNSAANSIYPSAVPTAPTLYPNAPNLYKPIELQALQAQQPIQLQPQQQDFSKASQLVNQPKTENALLGLQQTPNSGPIRAESPNVVIVKNGLIPFGPSSQKTVCPHCAQEMQTHLKHRPTFRTHIMALIFCVTGFWCLVPLPYCLNSCQKIDHFCNKCGQYVGQSGM